MKNTSFMDAKEIEEVTGVSLSYAYKIIQTFNKELRAQGKYTFRGLVSREYFYDRLGLGGLEDASVQTE